MANAERDLVNTVVAITGGARGIGRATAEALVAAGAKVALGDLDAAQVAQTAAELGGGTIGLPLDVTDRDSFASFLDETEARLGPLKVLINNAGIMPLGSFAQETDTIASRQIDINLKGVIYGSKLAIDRFTRTGGGQLVNVASTAGKFGAPGGATYSATKHAVVGLSEAIRREVQDLNIDVTIVMPLVVNTDLGSGLHDTRGLKVLQPADVANAIVDALHSGKVDVYVPRWIGAILRVQYVTPRPVVDLLVKLFGAGDVLSSEDATGRAAYNALIAQSAAAVPAPKPSAPPAGPAQSRDPAAVGEPAEV